MKMEIKNQVLYFFQEITIVVIGVLIAVSIGNYKEKLDNEQYIKKTLLAIENDIKLSQRSVDTVLSKHIDQFNEIQEIVEEGGNELSLGELVASLGGFQVASTGNISLRFFISNKAELLEYELISQLLEIEQRADLLATKLTMLSEYAYEHVNESDEEVLIKFFYLLANVIDSEEGLLEAYSEFLENNSEYLEKSKAQK